MTDTIKLTRDQVVALGPCSEDRIPNFGRRKSMSAAQALEAGATIDDLLWVAGQLGRKDLCVKFALACAQRVAHLNPDPRVPAAIDAAAAWVADPSEENRAAAWAAGAAAWAAWDAAWAAGDAARAAAWAARDAGAAAWAAWDAAWAAGDAARAAAWAARDAARAAAWAARAAGDAAWAARAATRAAAWAAWDAARAAAGAAGDAARAAAAGDAEREAQRAIFLEIFG